MYDANGNCYSIITSLLNKLMGSVRYAIWKGDLNKRADKGQTIVYNNGLFRRSTSYFLTLSPSAGPMHFLHVPWRRKT
ncbi:unnamed protein product [Nezara viridula]|uniref:Uncharacterized protein n=1 Tax=Nezara viridula TaxID=85310 RepID=A0A9P0HJQ5_NEZVI|nr:unnamed protein product [Nezara viridula]